jgi:hypothetical protein
MRSYLDGIFAAADLRFMAALEEANMVRPFHQGAGGARFEADVRQVIGKFLPAAYCCNHAVLGPDADLKKQLDLVVHSRDLPEILRDGVLPIEFMTVIGEVKTNLRERASILETARRLADSAAAGRRQHPIPFFVFTGAVEASGHDDWLADLVLSAPDAAPAWPVWMAAFSIDGKRPISVLRVSATSPIRAFMPGRGAEELDGAISIAGNQLSPSGACYLWLWAAIFAYGAYRNMDYRYMRELVLDQTRRAEGIEVNYHPRESPRASSGRRVILQLADEPADSGLAAFPITRIDGDQDKPRDDAQDHPTASVSPMPAGGRRVILITLGAWVDEADTWDESAWGGSATAWRRGYGYYEGMSDTELLDAARLFWRFTPDSGTWDGIAHAVVAHGGITRAVIQIDRTIGPFWGRHGFQGCIDRDSPLARDLVGREVPRRQNPITTIEL